MNKKAFAIAIAAACMTSGAAFAQTYDYRNDRDGRSGYEYQQRSQHYDRSGYDARRGYDNRYDARHNDYRRDRQYGYNDGYRHTTHRPYVHLRRGERMHHYYTGNQYVVRDWHRHRGLYAPHRGHQWVQVGNDYALVAIATGLIAQVLLNR